MPSRYTSDEDFKRTVILNISGKKFETFASTLKQFPGTRLDNLTENSPSYRADLDEYFFERNPYFFAQILNLYRFGTLHLQRSICGPIIKRELDFWGISMGNLERCCLHYFKACVSNDTALEVCDIVMPATIDNRLAELFSINLTPSERVRQFIEDPSFSRASKCYNWLVRLFIVGSIATMFIVNTDEFRVPARQPRITTTNLTNPKLLRLDRTDPHPAVYAIEIFLMVFFTVELIVRWIVASSRQGFFKVFINVVELVVLVPKWIAFALPLALVNTRFCSHHPIWYTLNFIVSLLIILRFVRLVEVCRFYSRITVLVLTLKGSTAEISFLLYLLSMVSVVFGMTAYYAELWEHTTFLDLPSAVYWAFMTMNIVGYGDIVPKSVIGRTVATMCCMCGVLFTGLAVPIISSNFRRYYDHFLPIQIRQTRGNSISEVRKMAARSRPFSEAHETAKTLRTRPKSRCESLEGQESPISQRPAFATMLSRQGLVSELFNLEKLIDNSETTDPFLGFFRNKRRSTHAGLGSETKHPLKVSQTFN